MVVLLLEQTWKDRYTPWNCASIHSCPIVAVPTGRPVGSGSVAKKMNARLGEVGILKEVSKYSVLSSDGMTLVMEHNGSAYMGVLLFDDFAFFRKIFDLLKTLRDRPIAEIGGLDIDATS